MITDDDYEVATVPVTRELAEMLIKSGKKYRRNITITAVRMPVPFIIQIINGHIGGEAGDFLALDDEGNPIALPQKLMAEKFKLVFRDRSVDGDKADK